MQMLIFFKYIECYYACKTFVNEVDYGYKTCDPSRTLIDSKYGENNKCLGIYLW